MLDAPDVSDGSITGSSSTDPVPNPPVSNLLRALKLVPNVTNPYLLEGVITNPDGKATTQPYCLPCTLAQLQRIRASIGREDVHINVEMMGFLGPIEARKWFEKGGEPNRPPTPEPQIRGPAEATEPAMLTLLHDCSAADEVRHAVGAHGVDEWCAALDVSRPAVLAEVKRLGVQKLGARQAFANALSRRSKAAKAKIADAAAISSIRYFTTVDLHAIFHAT